MTPIVIHLPGKPVAKARPRFVKTAGRSGFAYTDKKTRDYERALATAGKAAMGNKPVLFGAISLSVIATLPIPKSWPKSKQMLALKGNIHPTVKPDWDNLAKVTDALNGIVFADDKQIVSARVTKVYSVNPSLRIEIEPMSGEPA